METFGYEFDKSQLALGLKNIDDVNMVDMTYG